MSIYKMARYFAWGLLLFPLSLVLLWAIITFMPGLASYLHNVVWGVLGQITSFSQISAVLENALSYSAFSLENFWISFLTVLFNALGDSLIIACCVFLTKSIFTAFTNKGRGRFTRPEWMLTFVGVLVGVGVCMSKGLLTANDGALLTLIVCLVCYIIGILLMLRGTVFKWGGRYCNRKAGFILNLLLGIVGDLYDTMCAMFIITGVVEGSCYVKAGGSVWVCILWILCSAFFFFIKSVLMEFLKPIED